MEKNKTFHRKKILVSFLFFFLCFLGLGVRLSVLMIGHSEYYGQKAVPAL